MFSSLFSHQPIRSILRDLKSGVLSMDSNIRNSRNDCDEYTMTIFHAKDGPESVKIVLKKAKTYYWEFARVKFESPTDSWMTEKEIEKIYVAGLEQRKREMLRDGKVKENARRAELYGKLNPKKVK